MTLTGLKEIISTKYLHRGDYTLSSGAKSDKYFDIKSMMGVEEYILYITQNMHLKTAEINPSSLGGTELGGAIIVAEMGRYYPKCYIRKSQRIHGLKKMIEGCPKSPILLVDDVISSSLTTVTAMCACWDAGYEVAGLLCVINRYGEDEIIYNGKTISIFSLFKESDFR